MMPWVLLHPLTAPVFQDGAGVHSVGPLISGQIAQLPFPGNGAVTFRLDSPWQIEIVELLTHQFQDVAATKAIKLVWAGGELVAVIGIGTAMHTLAQACAAAEEAAHTMRRIHENEVLRQQLSAHRHLNGHFRESLLVVRSDGKIEMGTATGWDALHAYMRRRQSKKDPVCRLPATMLETLPNSEKTILGKLAVTAYLLPGEYETLIPMKVVFLEPVQKVGALNFEQKVAALTVSQRATYNLIVGGYRNKEIASELGVSYNTAIHHVGAVLHGLECQDRLQLMAMAAVNTLKRGPAVLAISGAPLMPGWARPAVKAKCSLEGRTSRPLSGASGLRPSGLSGRSPE